MPLSSRRVSHLLLLLILLSTGFRILFAWTRLGFLGGDEVEILATAFHSALGLDYQPYQIRNLMLPKMLVSPLLAVAADLGLGSREALIRLALLPFLLLGSLNIWLVFLLATRWLQERSVALLAAALYACHPLVLVAGSSALPRVAASTAILGGALALSASGRHVMRAAVAGGLLSLAIACRYSEVIYLVPLAAVGVLWSGGGRDAWTRVGVLGLASAVGSLATIGWADWVAWGAPFASLKRFATYTLIERRASTLEVEQPFWWYLRRLPRWLPLSLLPLAPCVPRTRALLGGWWFLLFPLLVLSAIYHKDLRYLQGVLPFLSILAAAGANRAWELGWRRLVAPIVGVTVLFGLASATRTYDRKSAAAVEAARWVTADLPAGIVVLSYTWAWGDLLLLGNGLEIRSLPAPLEPDDLERAIRGADRVGLLARELEADPSIAELLARHGFRAGRRFDWRRGPSVVVFEIEDGIVPPRS